LLLQIFGLSIILNLNVSEATFQLVSLLFEANPLTFTSVFLHLLFPHLTFPKTSFARAMSSSCLASWRSKIQPPGGCGCQNTRLRGGGTGCPEKGNTNEMF
jgi:hypothetical protein